MTAASQHGDRAGRLAAWDRRERERLEEELLAPAATRSSASEGRLEPEPPDPYRTAFERDRDRILHAKSFRRLKHKTQVFVNPEGDHFVTRLTHTLQVAQIGRSIARALGLNEALTEAICLAHDIGHSPFGHAGEQALTPYIRQLAGPDTEWLHSVQSVRVLRDLEPLNLTAEVLDGVRAHSWKIDPPPRTPEGACCRFADRIAYLAHDAQDALRAGVLAGPEIPERFLEALGGVGRDWIDTLVTAVIDASARRGEVVMEEATLEVMHDLRAFMFERVYGREAARRQAEKAVRMIQDLVEFFAAAPGEIPPGYAREDDEPLQQAIDYVAGMTDRYAVATHDRLFRPEGLY